MPWIVWTTTIFWIVQVPSLSSSKHQTMTIISQWILILVQNPFIFMLSVIFRGRLQASCRKNAIDCLNEDNFVFVRTIMVVLVLDQQPLISPSKMLLVRNPFTFKLEIVWKKEQKPASDKTSWIVWKTTIFTTLLSKSCSWTTWANCHFSINIVFGEKSFGPHIRSITKKWCICRCMTKRFRLFERQQYLQIQPPIIIFGGTTVNCCFSGRIDFDEKLLHNIILHSMKKLSTSQCHSKRYGSFKRQQSPWWEINFESFFLVYFVLYRHTTSLPGIYMGDFRLHDLGGVIDPVDLSLYSPVQDIPGIDDSIPSSPTNKENLYCTSTS